MRRALLWCLSVGGWLALTSLAAFGAESNEASKSPRIVISGQVVDSDQVAAPEARVEVHSRTTTVTARTDRTGKFSVNLPLTYCGVSITATAGDRAGMQWLPLNSSLLEPRTVSIELSPLIPFEVHVTDGAGSPVAGARVGADIHGVGLPAVESDATGKATLRIPRRANNRVVYAYKAGHGFDFHRLGLGRNAAKGRDHANDPLTLKLAPAGSKLTIRAKSDDGQPVAGLLLRPFQLAKPGELVSLGLSSMPGLYSATTNAEGIAHFDDLPSCMRSFEFSILDDRTAVRRFAWYSTRDLGAVIDVTIPRPVKLSGRLQFADGKPAADVAVEALGAGASRMSESYGRALSRRDGTFAIDIQPNQAYLIRVDDRKWAAGAIEGIAATAGQPIAGVALTLRQPTRVRGKVGLGRAHQPLGGQVIVLEQLGRALLANSAHQPPSGTSLWFDAPFRRQTMTTDQNGRYQFDLGPGRYTIAGPLYTGGKRFTVTDQAELRFDFDVIRPTTGPVSLTVVDAASGRPVPHTTIRGLGDVRQEAFVSTDDSGQFHGQRRLFRTLLSALGPDKKSAGMLEIGPDESAASIRLQRMGTAVGKVENAMTHAPLSHAVVQYEPCVGALMHYSGSATTDAQGNLRLDSLLPLVKYDLFAGASRARIGAVSVASAETKQIGTLILDKRSKLPSLQLEIADNLSADPWRDYLSARERARLYRQRVIVFLIDPHAAPSCELMKSVLHPPRVDTLLREAYCRLTVDAKSEPGKALAQSLKISTDAGSLPQIVVRDAQGGALVSRDAGDIFADAESNATNLVEFLERHACEPLDARNLWEGGLAQARKSNRRVLLVHASSGRDDSDRILRYLDATRNLWEKDFILVRIDDRWTNSQDVLGEIGLLNQGDNPRLAILDARGKVHVSANYGRRIENESHPRIYGHTAEDLPTMFRDNSRRLSDDDLWSLRIALDAVPRNFADLNR